MKVFISQPMRDKTDEEILSERDRALNRVRDMYKNEEIELVDTFFSEEYKGSAKPPLYYLGKSIQKLGEADIAYFIGEWKEYRGCRIENYTAKEYGIKVIEE